MLRGILRAVFKTEDDIVPDTFAVFRTDDTFRRFPLKKETIDGVGDALDSVDFDGLYSGDVSSLLIGDLVVVC